MLILVGSRNQCRIRLVTLVHRVYLHIELASLVLLDLTTEHLVTIVQLQLEAELSVGQLPRTRLEDRVRLTRRCVMVASPSDCVVLIERDLAHRNPLEVVVVE